MRSPQRVPATGLPARVTLVEVGARDGLQNEKQVIPTPVKIELIDRLVAAGHTVVEAAGFVHPDWVPQLADAGPVLDGIGRPAGVRFPVLVPNLRGLERALERGVRDVSVFASATESFSKRNLNRTVAESLEMIAPVVEGARTAGCGVRGYVSMVFGDPWEGAVDPGAVVDVAARLMRIGCTELSLGDTIGVGTPGQVVGLLRALEEGGVGVDRIGVHFHDTYGQALANVLAALQAGVTIVDSSAGGLGGCPYAESSAGNLATEDLVWMLEGLGVQTGVDLEALVETSAWLAGHLGRPPASRCARALGRELQGGG